MNFTIVDTHWDYNKSTSALSFTNLNKNEIIGLGLPGNFNLTNIFYSLSSILKSKYILKNITKNKRIQFSVNILFRKLCRCKHHFITFNKNIGYISLKTKEDLIHYLTDIDYAENIYESLDHSIELDPCSIETSVESIEDQINKNKCFLKLMENSYFNLLFNLTDKEQDKNTEQNVN